MHRFPFPWVQCTLYIRVPSLIFATKVLMDKGTNGFNFSSSVVCDISWMLVVGVHVHL